MATLLATNPLLSRSVADSLYDYALSSSYRTAFVYEPSFALSRTPDVWEIVRNDVSFSASFDRYSNNVTKPWHVEAPKKSKDKKDQQYAGVVEDALGQIFDFDTSRWVLSEAAFLGRKYAFIESERKSMSLDGTQEMDWIIPKFIKDIDRRRFRWVPVLTGSGDTAKRTTKLSFWNSLANTWQDVAPEFRQALIEYIWYNTEDRIGYGRGWLEPIYFAHYMKTNAIQKVADGIDRWAKGIWVVKLDGLRNGSTAKTNDALLAGAKTMIQVMRSDNIAVMENVDDIDIKESTGTGHEMGMGFVDYWDNGVERLVNGSTRPAGLGGQKTGARAQSETEEDTSEAHYQPARDRIDAVINRDLIGWFIGQPLNRINLQKLGLLDARRPIYHTRQEKKMTIPDVVASASMFLDRGMPLIEGEVYERCGGWGVPSPDDNQITGKMPMGQGEMIGDFGKADEINTKADQNAAADRKAKKPAAKMDEEGHEAQFSEDRLIERIAAKLMPYLGNRDPQAITINTPDVKMTADIHMPASLPPNVTVTPRDAQPNIVVNVPNQLQPNVTVNVPQQAAPIINNIMPEQPAPTVINNVKASDVIVQEAAKLEQKNRHVEIQRNEDGKIKSADITSK